MDEKIKMINSKKYDVFAIWHMGSLCNFNCKYCFNSLEDRKNSRHLSQDNMNKLINFFNKSRLKFLIHMTGGEPFLHPEFVKLCESLTKEHYISISTNLSTNLVNDFARKIDPKRVEAIHCSLHISEREKLNLKEDFIRKFNTLKKAGFNIFANQVMYPENLNRFDETFKYFESLGIVVFPKVFRGVYNGKEYPEAYTKKEKEKLYLLRKESLIQETKDRNLVFQYFHEPLDGQLSFTNLLCSAGRKFIAIDSDGIIKRCLNENTYMGNIFKKELRLFSKDRICKAKICQCPYFGLVFASGKPRLVTEQAYRKFLKRFIYPYTTSISKPLRKNLKKIFYSLYKK